MASRSLRRIFALSTVAASVLAAVACATSEVGDGPDEADEADAAASADTGTTLRVPDAAPAGDAGREDAQATDAAADAAPDAPLDAPPDAPVGDAGPPPTGASCATPDTVFTRTCGFCGTQQAICLATGVVSDYSPCRGEVADAGCSPGTTRQAACGLCGTRPEVCSNTCSWTVGQCAGEPANACQPGRTESSNAGCADPATFRTRECQATCTWGAFTQTCEPPNNGGTTLVVPGQVGAIATVRVELTSAQVAPRINQFSTCPNGSVFNSTCPYAFVEMHNPTASTATVTVYNTTAPGGQVIDTVMTAYRGNVAPATEAERKACAFGPSGSSTAALTGDTKYAALTGTTAVTLAPGARAIVWFSANDNYNAADPAKTTGPVLVVARTDALN